MGKAMRLPAFRVTVTRDLRLPGMPPVVFQREVKSQNAAHAAACGLSLASCTSAETIEVLALSPRPGRSPLTIFHGCSSGSYGFCYTSRSFADPT
jgi:hypothetical protein